MPEQHTTYIRKPDRGMLAVAGFLGAGGVALIVWAVARGQEIPLPPLAPLKPGETMGRPFSATLSDSGPLQVRRGDLIPVMDPMVEYQGTGRDTFSYCSVVQLQGRQWVTVYGSGVAGVHIGPSQALAAWHLVSMDQLQPPGCPEQSLCMFPWPGPQPTPICGAPAEPGYAAVILEVYEKRTPADQDGFSAPTCNDRFPVQRHVYNNKIVFV